jgi:hypothetical protein
LVRYIFGKENKSESKNGSFRVFETPKKPSGFGKEPGQLLDFSQKDW